MARGESPKAEAPRACCLVSEILEEAGLDRENTRRLRRQLLEGMILFCRWQLERMESSAPSASARKPRARKVAVE
jgi:hypothetical protein